MCTQFSAVIKYRTALHVRFYSVSKYLLFDSVIVLAA